MLFRSGLLILALGTGSVFTGVVVVVKFLTVFTEPGMSAEMRCSAGENIADGFFLMGRHNSAVALQIFSAMLMENIGESGHRSAMTWLRIATGLARALLIRRV